VVDAIIVCSGPKYRRQAAPSTEHMVDAEIAEIRRDSCG
jgi:hypothetical protein